MCGWPSPGRERLFLLRSKSPITIVSDCKYIMDHYYMSLTYPLLGHKNRSAAFIDFAEREMQTRESPYPPLGPDGNVQQQQQNYEQPAYAPPQHAYQAPQQPQYQMNQSQPYATTAAAGNNNAYYQGQQPTYNAGGNKQWEGQYTQDYGDKTQKFDNMKPK